MSENTNVCYNMALTGLYLGAYPHFSSGPRKPFCKSACTPKCRLHSGAIICSHPEAHPDSEAEPHKETGRLIDKHLGRKTCTQTDRQDYRWADGLTDIWQADIAHPANPLWECSIAPVLA